MSNPYLGEIRMFAGNFAPASWQLCSGQTLSISQYQALFALIGTFYGGNGTTTFQLPDLRGRLPIGQGQGVGLSTYGVGEETGTDNVSLLPNNMPIHSHFVEAMSPAPPSGTNVPTNGYLSATERNETPVYSSAAPSVAMGPQSVGLNGSSVALGITKPSLTINFIIAMAGIFPSRN